MGGRPEAALRRAVNPGFQFDWTEERVATLKRLWIKGETASEIARALGSGCTRNSVLGKASRLKLGSRGERVRVPKSRAGHSHNAGGLAFKIARARQERPDATSVVEVMASMRAADPAGQKLLRGAAWEAIPGTEPISLLQLNEHTCKWPVGDAPIVFCGLHSDAGSPYCEQHHRLATIGGSHDPA
jgi:GcrA cell cycle regulator